MGLLLIWSLLLYPSVLADGEGHKHTLRQHWYLDMGETLKPEVWLLIPLIFVLMKMSQHMHRPSELCQTSLVFQLHLILFLRNVKAKNEDL